MNVEHRRSLLVRLGNYLSEASEEWQAVKEKATAHNAWFTPEFIDLSTQNIASSYLSGEALTHVITQYKIPGENPDPKKVGIVMAGNIPMVGIHDLICCFLIGHFAVVKMSSKDNILPEHLVKKLIEFEPSAAPYFTFSEMLKGCDAYIATGSDNSARYFEYYFSKYPHIIRKNRTSVAVLTGDESRNDLEKLADDVYQYFGLGCRNVTKLYVPAGYDFVPLLEAFKKYDSHFSHNKYKNNYDYNLAIHIMNNKFYMTNGSVILIENDSPFSPISQVNYEYYSNVEDVLTSVKNDNNIQCVVGNGQVPFGGSQCPSLDTFADGVDTLAFLKNL